MHTKRLIHLIALTCLLPAATGCATRSSVDLSTEPAGIPEPLASGERVRVGGFTRAGGEHVKWEGHVSFVPPDSLLFDPGNRPKPATFGGRSAADPGPDAFTVPLSAIASLDVYASSDLVTSILILPLVAVGLGIVLLGAYAASGGTMMEL